MTFLNGTADVKGGLKTLSIVVALLAAFGGWTFTLGVNYQQIQHHAGEIETLRADTRRATSQSADLSERIARLETSITSMDATLRDIRNELRGASRGEQ